MGDGVHSDATDADRAAAEVRFDTVVVPHLEVLFRVARSITPNTDDAEDLVQDTLLRAFRATGSFDGRYPRSWLLTIMRNANQNRTRRRRPTLLRDESTMDAELDRRNPPSPSAEDVATRSMTAPWVADALDHLSPRLRQVIELVDVDGLTYDETAAVLAIPPGTVMSRLHRARHRMRARLEDHPDFRNEDR